MDRDTFPDALAGGRDAELGESQGLFSEDGVDLTLIQWFLSLTPLQRLEAAQDMVDTAWALREGRQT